MREIKYRAWDKATNQWRYGSTSPYYGDRPFTVMYLSRFFEWLENSGVIDASTLGEYIGLKDKNGKEIYEGDILIWTSPAVTERWVVKTTEGGWNPFIDNMTTGKSYRYRVIGNIHENPELVGEGRDRDGNTEKTNS